MTRRRPNHALEPTTQLVVGDLVRFEAFDPPAIPARIVPRDEVALEAEWAWFESYFREMYHYRVGGDTSYRQGWRGAWDVALKDLAERRRARHAGVAQSIERAPSKREVVGANPTPGTTDLP